MDSTKKFHLLFYKLTGVELLQEQKTGSGWVFNNKHGWEFKDGYKKTSIRHDFYKKKLNFGENRKKTLIK